MAMNPELQRRVQRYGWDHAAPYYDSSWERQLETAQKKLLEMAALRPGEDVLDIACGSGLVTFPAARSVGSDGAVTGVDISDGMLGLARNVAEEHGMGSVEFARMDAENLDFAPGSFDAVLCGLGLMYVPDPVRSLQEMYKVARDGGRAAVAVWGQRSSCGWAEVFPIVDRRVASDVCPMFFQLGMGRALEVAFSQAGFYDVTSERISVTLHYDSAEEACAAVFAGGPVAMAYRKFDDATREGAHREYLDSIEPYRLGEQYRIPGEFVIACGWKPRDGD